MTGSWICVVAGLTLLAGTAAGCGGDSVDESEPALNPEIALNQVLADPAAYDAVTINAQARPLGRLGFIIEQGGVSVFVDAPPDVATGIEDGDEVRVTGSVGQLSEEQASKIRRKVRLNTGDSDGYDERAYADTRITQGATYLDLIHLSPGDD